MGQLLGLIGLPNPAVLIGMLIALAGVAGWSYHAGDEAGANRCEAHYSAVKDTAADELSKQLAAANQRAVSAANAARVAADKEVAAKTKLNAVLEGIRNAPAMPASCITADLRVRVNSAVSAINDYGNPTPVYTTSVSGKLPTATGVGK